MFFSSPGQTYFIALFGGEIRTELGLSHGQFGALYSAATLCSAMTLLWSGALLDRLKLRPFTMGIVVLMAMACAFMSTAQNAVMLFLGIFLLRQLGQGLMSMTSSTTMMRYLSYSKGKANSLSNMGYSVAESLMPSVIIILLLSFSWRQVWQLTALVLVLIVPVILMRLSREQPKRHQRYLAQLSQDSQQERDSQAHRGQRQWTRAEMIRDPLLYLFVPSLVSQSLLYTGFMFHQIHLAEAKGWPLIVWGSMYFLFSVTTIVSSLGIGALVDKIGAVRLTPFIALPMAVGLLALSSSDTILVAALFMVTMGVSTGAQAAISAPFYAERYGNKHFASIKSLASFIMVIMTAVSPVIIGWFIDAGTSINTLALGGSVYAVSVSCIGFIAYRLSLANGD